MQRTASTTSYQRLEQRIAAQLSCPLARLRRQAVIHRRPDEAEEDWEHLIEALEDDPRITVSSRPGEISIRWESLA